MHGEKNELFLRLAWTAVTDGMFSISRKKEKKFVSWTEIREVSGGRTQGVPSLLCGATESIQWKKIRRGPCQNKSGFPRRRSKPTINAKVMTPITKLLRDAR